MPSETKDGMPPTEAEQRRARQAAALRENLRRRKARARQVDDPASKMPGGGESGQ